MEAKQTAAYEVTFGLLTIPAKGVMGSDETPSPHCV